MHFSQINTRQKGLKYLLLNNASINIFFLASAIPFKNQIPINLPKLYQYANVEQPTDQNYQITHQNIDCN